MRRSGVSCYNKWEEKTFLLIKITQNISYFINIPIELISHIINFYLNIELIAIPDNKINKCLKCKIIWWKDIIYEYRYVQFNNLEHSQDGYYFRSYIYHCEQDGCHNIRNHKNRIYSYSGEKSNIPNECDKCKKKYCIECIKKFDDLINFNRNRICKICWLKK